MKLVWDEIGERFYETGVKNGVLYPMGSNGGYSKGVAWNGLISVTESPSGAEPNPIYADDMKYLTLISVEEFGATIEAYTYPEEFAICDGSAALEPGVMIGQQPRRAFGLCYRTALGNDVDGEEYGYKLHIIYGALASPSEKAYQTINDSPEAITFSWELTTTPVAVTGFKPTASLTIESTSVESANLEALETILYGSEGVDPRLPMPDEIKTLFAGSGPADVALVSISPEDNEHDVEVDTAITLTFNNKIVEDSIIVTKNDGTIVEGEKVWNAAGKVVTFTPTDDLDIGGTYLVTIGGVADIYGKTLAPSVKNFTTVIA